MSQTVGLKCSLCEQDWFIRATIIATGEAIRVCPECDAVALGHDARAEPELTFESCMESRGLPKSWEQISIVDMWRFPEQEEGQPYRVPKK
jgi:hypothetical protein